MIRWASKRRRTGPRFQIPGRLVRVNFLFTASSKDDGLIFMSLSPHLLVYADKFSRNATDTAFFQAKKCSLWSSLFLIETGGLWPRRLAARRRQTLPACGASKKYCGSRPNGCKSSLCENYGLEICKNSQCRSPENPSGALQCLPAPPRARALCFAKPIHHDGSALLRKAFPS